MGQDARSRCGQTSLANDVFLSTVTDKIGSHFGIPCAMPELAVKIASEWQFCVFLVHS